MKEGGEGEKGKEGGIEGLICRGKINRRRQRERSTSHAPIKHSSSSSALPLFWLLRRLCWSSCGCGLVEGIKLLPWLSKQHKPCINVETAAADVTSMSKYSESKVPLASDENPAAVMPVIGRACPDSYRQYK